MREPGGSSHLRAVPEPAAAPDRPAGGPDLARPTRRRRLPMAAGVLLLVLLAALALHQWRRASRLEARVGELASALSEAESRVAAQREHLGVIQEQVGELRRGFEALEALVEQDPTASPGERP